MSSDREARFGRTCEARDAFWQAWGEVDPQVLAPLINPGLSGLPSWPRLRQAYRTVRRGSLTLLATDGLSDPFDDPGRSTEQGFGLECFAVTKDVLPSPVQSSWLFDMLFQVSLNAADHGGFRDVIERAGLVSMQLFDVRVPREWSNDDGSVGVLLNLQDTRGSGVAGTVVLPVESALVVSVKLLAPSEFEYCVQGGSAARAELGRLFHASGKPQQSSLQRKPVV